MTELWKDIPKSEGKYQVSDNGRISSSKFFGEVRLLSTYLDGRYTRVTLHLNGRHIKPLVHRLVMEAFVGPRPDGYEVNHIDGNKLNNALSNLEYTTSSENMKHAFGLGLMKPARGEKHGQAKLTTDDVKKIRILHATGNSTYSELGKQFGVTLQQIRSVVMRVTWKHVE